MHPRGCSDVPLQQSRRAARAPVDHGRLLRDARGQRGIVAVAGSGGCGDGLCVSDQDVPGLPRVARIYVGLLDFCADNLVAAGAPSPRRRGVDSGRGVDGGCWRCNWCPRTHGPTSAGPPTTPCSIWRSGYNGISRILGRHPEYIHLSGTHLTAFSARTGLHRLFTGEMGNEIAWLLLAALFALAFGAVSGRAAVTRPWRDVRADDVGLLVRGDGVVLSYMGGTVHPYYTVALAPAIAALIGLGGVWAWRRRAAWDGRFALARDVRAGRDAFGSHAAPQSFQRVRGRC